MGFGRRKLSLTAVLANIYDGLDAGKSSLLGPHQASPLDVLTRTGIRFRFVKISCKSIGDRSSPKLGLAPASYQQWRFVVISFCSDCVL
ncbi:hypothetical protein CEXT_569621 [Caerostris extrusa]|uniref:Uncharacterized protein n=1 Tax=Caerostris extrusa TaxID=172846 RepID=A0AAV4RIL4_CAEEX|nr:hypothetical protein CEXT_569621 [Caerostris extrusa]